MDNNALNRYIVCVAYTTLYTRQQYIFRYCPNLKICIFDPTKLSGLCDTDQPKCVIGS